MITPKNAPKNFPDIVTNEGTIVGYKERLYKYFEIPPKHNFNVGDLVTCDCHGGVAMIIELHDKSDDHPAMDMAKIYWIVYPHDGVKERVWMHTISRLRKANRE